MLQFATLPASLSAVLAVLRPCFTAPSFATFAVLLAGMIARPARRSVCGMLIGAGMSRLWHHSRAHWFFSRARWSTDQIGLVLLKLVADTMLGPGTPVLIAVDDTLFRRSGRKVTGAFWHHDGSRTGPHKSQVSWGNCFVVAGIVIDLPFCDRPVCLPILARLWTPRQATKTVLAAQMLALIAAALPGRRVHMVADAAYAGTGGAPADKRRRGRDLPEAVTLTSRLRVNAVFNATVRPEPNPRGGRPKTIGARLGTAADLATTATWQQTTIRRYGTTTNAMIADITCLWYGTFRSRPIRVILVRNPDSKTTTGYDLALITTDPHTPATAIAARYAARWSIEVAFEDAKQTTGVGEARNRTPQAVARTVPFGLLTQTIVIIWYARHGHHPDITAARRAEAPWYQTKTQPAYLDMIVKLRRTLIAARFLPGKARKPTPEETLAVQLAWAEAAA